MTLSEYLTTTSGKSHRQKGLLAAQRGEPRAHNPWLSQSTPLRRGAWWAGWDDHHNRHKHPITAFELHDFISSLNNPDNPNTSEDDTDMSDKQLYEHDGKFYTRIGTNSQNLAVVEEKGTGQVSTIDPAQLKKVIPYTIEITFNGHPQHFIAKPGQVKEGEVILSTRHGERGLGIVTAINTENTATRAELSAQNFRRVQTEAL